MKKTCVYLLAILIFTNCDKDFDYDSIRSPEGLSHWNIISVTGPSSGSINQTIEIEVTYPTTSGCDLVTEFGTSEYKSDIYVKAFGYTITSIPCTMTAVPKRTIFSYQLTKAGSVTFKFINRNNSIIEHKVFTQ